MERYVNYLPLSIYFDLSVQTKRLKVIFSVLAAPSRLEILKILSAKGGMTYTELKEAAGFMPKRESGKFAYHLKKLVQQSLIVQNRQERKYTLSPLGRLVLTLSKQIEEQTILSSGRLFVRETSQRMEEFDPSKIVQSLVKEADMPLETAQNIATEAESRIYKFQLNYLTSPLIREVVNSILLEQGYEQYWRRLSRLGMPVYDLEVLLEESSKSGYGLEEAIYGSAYRIFSDYLMRSPIPSEIVDSHLNGDIHLPRPETWMLKPDIVVIDMERLRNYPVASGFTDDVSGLIRLIYELSREVSGELYIKGGENIMETMGETFFKVVHELMPNHYRSPTITVEAKKVTPEIIANYEKYYLNEKKPRVVLSTDFSMLPSGWNANYLIQVDKKTSMGSNWTGEMGLEIQVIASSINLPRLAYEAQGEESYFRIKSLLLKDMIKDAMAQKTKFIVSRINEGQLPFLRSLIMRHPSEYITTLLNLTGLREAMIIINVDKESVVKEEMDYISMISDKIAPYISMIKDDGDRRLALLDQERHGKKISSTGIYSQGYVVDSKNDEVLHEVRELNPMLKGGLSLTENLTENYVQIDGITHMIKRREIVCSVCGWTNPVSRERCRHCNAPLQIKR